MTLDERPDPRGYTGCNRPSREGRQSGGGSPLVAPLQNPMHDTDTRAAATKRSSSHILARNIFFLLAGQVVSSVLSLILTAVLGRWLGVEDFGIYYLLVAFSTFAYVLVDWGQSAYLIRESARRHEDDGKLLGGALVFRAVAAFVAALVTVVLVRAL